MIGVIGGTGIYSLEGLRIKEEASVDTPFGTPSAALKIGDYNGKQVIFLPRHGDHHQFLPGEVNYRANIYALKSAGVTEVIGVSAVGSLRKEIAPGDFSVPSQYFDWTKGRRESTFFGNGMAAHVSMAHPVCPRLSQAIFNAADAVGENIHRGKTYATVEGPRFGTQAESHFLRSAGCDLVGMTNVPEAFLAREAQICYSAITIATDYDCWLDDPDQHATIEAILERYGASLARIQKLLARIIDNDLPEHGHDCRNAIQSAVMTPEERLTPTQSEVLKILRK